MLRMFRPAAIAAALVVAVVSQAASAADTLKIDGAHSSVAFSVRHAGVSDVHGLFADTSGKVVIDADAAKSSFEAEIKVDSVYTGQPKRDEHLKKADFFNAAQFPTITFKSTKVAATEGGYEVTGDFTLHGVTKPVTLKFAKAGPAEFPKGVERWGFTTSTTIKRSEFGMTGFIPMVSDEVKIDISFEVTK